MADSRTTIQARYDSKNRKSYALKLHLTYDNDIIQRLNSVESINGYIKQLIREDIARTGSAPKIKMEDKKMTKIEVIKKYSDSIKNEMVDRYSSVLDSFGRIQYQIYIWDDGEIECLEGVQGDNSYLKAKDSETRNLYYVCTVSAPNFDPWDYSDHAAPDNETERETERTEIIDYLVDEYKQNLPDVFDAIIEEATNDW